jgi:hypothetical protein
MPLVQYVIVTAAYSNAVLSAIMPHISDYAKQLDLPIPLPITQSQISHAGIDNRLGRVGAGIWLTNNYWFMFSFGTVISFRLNTNNPFLEQNPTGNWSKYAYGEINMTKGEAIQLARDSIGKLGYNVKELNADVPPTTFTGPYTLPNGHQVPYCEFTWDVKAHSKETVKTAHYYEFQVDMDRKHLIAMSLIGERFWTTNPPLSVKPILVEDAINGGQSRMHTNTNAPAELTHH